MFAAAAIVLLAQTAAPTPVPCGCQADAQIVYAQYPEPEVIPPADGPFDATVAVTVGADGKVKNAKILQSSGNLGFDMASIRAAKESKYKAKLVDCHPVESVIPFKTFATRGTPPPMPPKPSPTPSCPPVRLE
jgi:TonB family protein